MARRQQELIMQALPDLPCDFMLAQCVSFPQANELLICGGGDNKKCYSYHLQKQQYRFICEYPESVVLQRQQFPQPIMVQGHVVLVCPSNFLHFEDDHNPNSNSDDTITLLSFGGAGFTFFYHTLMMKYKSVWNYEPDSKDIYNKWLPLPNEFHFGEQHDHDLFGARAVIGGSKHHLLFITSYPCSIDIVDLRCFKYLDNIKNKSLPLAEGNSMCCHCFESLEENGNKFFLMSRGEALFIQYDEINNEFSYQHSLFYLKNLSSFGSACWMRRRIFILGGQDKNADDQSVDRIWTVDITKKDKQWTECEITLPFPMYGVSAVVSENDFSIHVIGGKIDEADTSLHYMISMLTPKDIATLVAYWMRIQPKKVKKGWIVELDRTVLSYIIGEYTNHTKKRIHM